MGDGITGTIPCSLWGGPFDGARYGDLPDLGPMTGSVLSIPLSEPAATSPRAVYRCTDSAPHDGLWRFVYTHTESPETQRVAAALEGNAA